MAAGRLDEAKAQFEMVKTLSPKEPFGSFGLGQVLSKQENYEEAIASFQAAIDIKSDYWEAFAEMGYAMANNGDLDQAQDIADNLLGNEDLMSFSLSNFIYDKRNPKMTATYGSDLYGRFPSTLGPGTQLSGINAYLQTANAEQTMAMVFQFSKDMDARSVENTFNWTIQRASGTGRGDGYNYDMKLKDTEVGVPPSPIAVYYDSEEKTATVLFKLKQNDTATGTIDPSHINFLFNGKDSLGLSMDKSADMYSGFSGFA
jgi:tetratricopeptide (TPR) repeat protein